MNYRHAFHAGNFADVMKHATLALVIQHLKQKPAPFRVIDTHAGAGRYDLTGDQASRTGEWREGIGRLMGASAAPVPGDVAHLLAPYFGALSDMNPDGELRFYPGSPCLAAALMRPVDRLIANELHPQDRLELEQTLSRDRRTKVMGIDGWQALRALLPPRERRGVVLIDPPFEETGEFDRLRRGLEDAVARFATGIFLLWLPLKDVAAVHTFRNRLAAAGYDKWLWAELVVASDSQRLAGSGLLVLNPPYRLDEQLEVLLPFLAERLSRGPGARWSCDCG
jgi:23S rRNA (adenine2030-N6)-methyltransferase